MKKYFVVLALMLALLVSGCATDADTASYNLSQAADSFEVMRRVVFYNGITADYILSVEGLCSIEVDSADEQLELTCKVGTNQYKKHFLGLSDNVTYFAEQIDSIPVNTYHYRVIFKPSTIVPDIDIQ